MPARILDKIAGIRKSSTSMKDEKSWTVITKSALTKRQNLKILSNVAYKHTLKTVTLKQENLDIENLMKKD